MTTRRLLIRRVVLQVLPILLAASFLAYLRTYSKEGDMPRSVVQSPSPVLSEKAKVVPVVLAAADFSEPVYGEKVDGLFGSFVQCRFKEPEGGYMGRGWMMTLPNGGKVDRNFLRLAAGPVISIGKNAVPHLFKWVRHDNQAIRYLAVFALMEITGIPSKASYFSEDQADWEKAIGTWLTWWRSNR